MTFLKEGQGVEWNTASLAGSNDEKCLLWNPVQHRQWMYAIPTQPWVVGNAAAQGAQCCVIFTLAKECFRGIQGYGKVLYMERGFVTQQKGVGCRSYIIPPMTNLTSNTELHGIYTGEFHNTHSQYRIYKALYVNRKHIHDVIHIRSLFTKVATRYSLNFTRLDMVRLPHSPRPTGAQKAEALYFN